MPPKEVPPKRSRSTRANRFAQVGGLATGQTVRHLGTRTANLVRNDARSQAALEMRNIEMANRLVTVLGSMRGAAMKLGQLFSLVDLGLVPASHREEFQAQLAALHANAPEVPWPEMRDLVEHELGARLRSAFREFDSRPVASASIGQVYRAVLRDGREVAVKVQYPGIDEAVRADMKNLAMLLKVYGRVVFEGLDTTRLMDELEARVLEEVDYVKEAQNTRQFADAFAEHPFIKIPAVHDELSSHRVLTTEWLEGRPLRSARRSSLARRNRISEILFRFYSGTPYRSLMYSGDPHPGNAVLLGGDKIGFLDFGLVKQIGRDVADGELESMRAAIEGDGERLVRIMHERGFILDTECVDPQDELDAMMEVGWWYFRDEEVELAPEAASEMAAAFANPVHRFGAMLMKQNIPPEHAFRARSELQLLAVMGQLRPRMNLHRIAREWIYGDEPSTPLGHAHQDWLRASSAASD